MTCARRTTGYYGRLTRAEMPVAEATQESLMELMTKDKELVG